MHFFIHFLVFIVILFIYMHVMEQYKTSEKMQLYEMDYIDNRELQTACNLKQPIVFEFRPVFSEFFYRQSPKIYLEQMGMIDMRLKDTDDYRGARGSIDSIGLSYRALYSLISSDTRAHYISEGNTEFVTDADLGSLYHRLDAYLKPPIYTCQTEYDILTGSHKATTPLRYHTHDRIFLCVIHGKLSVKMTPWKSRARFGSGANNSIVKDYENYEFRVPGETPWESNGLQTHYLEFRVLSGQIVFVPAYWFYTIRFDETDTVVAQIKYNSPINMLANARDIVSWYFQQKNIVRVSDSAAIEVATEDCHTGVLTTPDGIDPARPRIDNPSLQIITRKSGD
jgi:hypothetical protein